MSIRRKTSMNLLVAALLLVVIIFNFSCSKSLAQLTSHCTENPPLLNSKTGNGHVEIIGGLNSYVAGNPHSKLAIVLITDIFGFEVPKLRLIADKVAAAGYYTLAPDFFHGEPYNPNNTKGSKDAWLKDHTPVFSYLFNQTLIRKTFIQNSTGIKLNVLNDATTLLADLKHRGMTKVGFAGFCWGGAVASKIAKFDDISAVVLLHPSYLIVDEIKEIRAPIEILAAALDGATKPAIMNQYKKIFTENHIDNRLKIFPNVSHGWTLRYNDSIPFVVKSAFQAHSNMLNWFTIHMK